MGGRGGWTVWHCRTFIGLKRSGWEAKGENRSRQGVESNMSCTVPLTTVVTLFKAIDIGVPGGVQGNDMRQIPSCTSRASSAANTEWFSFPITMLGSRIAHLLR